MSRGMAGARRGGYHNRRRAGDDEELEAEEDFYRGRAEVAAVELIGIEEGNSSTGGGAMGGVWSAMGRRKPQNGDLYAPLESEGPYGDDDGDELGGVSCEDLEGTSGGAGDGRGLLIPRGGGVNGGGTDGLLDGDSVVDEEPSASWGSCHCLHGRTLVYVCAVCSSLSSILLGYDVGVMSGAKEYMSPDLGLDSTQEEIVVGSLNLVAAFGGLLAGSVADAVGRRMAILLSSVIFILGALIMVTSTDFEQMLAGRVVTGIGVGCAMVVAPVYITELAPPDIRGMLVSLTDICINLGILLGYGSSLVCDILIAGEGAKWRAMIGIGIVPPALIVLCLTIMPESPRWLLSKGRRQEGYNVLKRVLSSPAEARENLHDITKSIEEHAQQEPTWAQVLFSHDPVRSSALFIGLGLGFWQQASGSEAAVYYSPEVLENSGWVGTQLLLGNMAVGAFKLAGEIVAFFLLDTYGRRPLLIVSAASSTVCLFFIGLSFSYGWPGVVLLSWLCSFMLCFSIGVGPVTFVVASEIFPMVMRSKAMGLVIFVNRFMSGIIALTYESVAKAMTPAGSFYMFSVISAMSVAFYTRKVPETFGKTLEDITTELEMRIASKQQEKSHQDGGGNRNHSVHSGRH